MELIITSLAVIASVYLIIRIGRSFDNSTENLAKVAEIKSAGLLLESAYSTQVSVAKAKAKATDKIGTPVLSPNDFLESLES